VHPVLARAGASAVRTDFAAAAVRTLWFQVGVFVLAFLLMLAWPRGAGRRAHALAGAAAGGASAGVPAAAGHGAAQVAAVAAGPAGPRQAT
jgi:hypothetical protein